MTEIKVQVIPFNALLLAFDFIFHVIHVFYLLILLVFILIFGKIYQNFKHLNQNAQKYIDF